MIFWFSDTFQLSYAELKKPSVMLFVWSETQVGAELRLSESYKEIKEGR